MIPINKQRLIMTLVIIVIEIFKYIYNKNAIKLVDNFPHFLFKRILFKRITVKT